MFFVTYSSGCTEFYLQKLIMRNPYNGYTARLIITYI
nr:MAG TPA: hypothetical protein [Caudoviricetes sp.]